MSHHIARFLATSYQGFSFIACLAVLTPTPGWAADLVAEEGADETEQAGRALLTITISAPPTTGGASLGVPQALTATAATTVTAEDIETEQMRRIDDALTRMPGVTLGAARGIGQPKAISIRGLGPRNTRVYIDGVEVSDPSGSQSSYPISAHTMSDVSRIDVLRGPQTGRYGADSGGGVIVIETRRPTDPLAGEASFEYGSYGTKRGHANLSGVQGPVDFRLSVAADHAEGYSDYNERRGGAEKDPFSAWSLGARLGYQVSDRFRLDFTGRYLDEDLNYDASYGDNDWHRDETERFLRLSGTLETFDGALVHRFGISDAATTRTYWGTGTAGDTYDGDKTSADYLASWAINDRVSLDLGGDLTSERMEQHTPGFAPWTPEMADDLLRGGGFATLGVTPLEGLDLSATLRVDSHETFGTKATYRLGAAYTVEQTGTTVRASYGTGWQTPSLYERYDPCYGRATLEPESSRGWDIGVDQTLLERLLTANATYFQVSTTNEIDFSSAMAAKAGCPYGGGYGNINETFVQGVELGLTASPWESLDLSLSYTWQNAVDASTDKRLDERPVNQGTASVTWRFLPEAMVNVGLRYRDQVTDFNGTADAFWTADVRGSVDIGDNVTLHGRIENLFDRKYEESVGYGTPGISGYGGLTVRF